MQLAPFLLDQWLEAHKHGPGIDYDMASSIGPTWTLREVLGDDIERLLDLRLVYAPAQGSYALREQVAAFHGVSPEAVQITTGAAEALLILFHRAAGPGANFVLPFPGFPTFEEVPRSLGVEVRRYHLRPEHSFAVDPDEIAGAIDDRTRLVLLNTPHNPTGAVSRWPEIEALHDLCARRGVQLVVDEVYHPIFHGEPVPSAAPLPHATVIHDLSKALCLSGLRLGWMIDHDADRRAEYLNARCYFTIASSPLTELVGELAMRRRDELLGRVRSIAAASRAALVAFVASHASMVDMAPPDGGLTAFPALRSGASARPLCEAAADRGVLLAPGDCFGMPSHFRIGLGATGERFADGLARLSEVMASRPPM
jgi:aspartate/methionine/tyrosine aminotransferase